MVHLDIGSNILGDDGATALGPHLARHSRLQYIDVGYNGIGAEGATALGAHLARLSSLLHHDLSTGRI